MAKEGVKKLKMINSMIKSIHEVINDYRELINKMS